jgi:tRNA 2-selenouridine synthase
VTAAIETITDLGSGALARFDAIIDVRSPSEFAEDRIPGAINLPVLNDAERAEIGTIYVQQSRFLARRLGAALIARNIANHLESALADKPSTFHPLLYCWRGGMRSGAMATVLSQVGWRCGVVAGGYKSWRRGVVEGLRKTAEPLRVVLLDGQTGTAKTEILGRLAALGVQTIDLEGLARHRGSVFGGYSSGEQPSQKSFESALWRTLSGFNPARAIVVEAESNRVGAVIVPRRLWLSMIAAPRIEIVAPEPARIAYLVRTYADLVADAARLETAIDRLRPFHAKALIDEWRGLAATQQHDALGAALMRVHYDPLYDRARRKRETPALADIKLADLSTDSLNAAALDIRATLERVFQS